MDFDDEFEYFPDLGHWKSVMEFSVEHAALLSAMIDPFDYDTLHKARAVNAARWKKAHGYALAIVSAIRQGLISPVVCKGFVFVEVHDWNGNPGVEKALQVIRPSDREAELSMADTIITRASLVAWIDSENVQITKPPKTISKVVSTQALPEITAAAPVESEPLALPSYTHRSEGLEFVEEAIRYFWSNYDANDPSTAPRKDEVVEYLKGRGASGRLSEAVDLILRPVTMRTAHLRNRKAPTREDP